MEASKLPELPVVEQAAPIVAQPQAVAPQPPAVKPTPKPTKEQAAQTQRKPSPRPTKTPSASASASSQEPTPEVREMSGEKAVEVVLQATGGGTARSVEKTTHMNYQAWAVQLVRHDGSIVTGYVERSTGVIFDWVVNQEAPAASTPTAGTYSGGDDDSDDADDDHEDEDHEDEDDGDDD